MVAYVRALEHTHTHTVCDVIDLYAKLYVIVGNFEPAILIVFNEYFGDAILPLRTISHFELYTSFLSFLFLFFVLHFTISLCSFSV